MNMINIINLIEDKIDLNLSYLLKLFSISFCKNSFVVGCLSANNLISTILSFIKIFKESKGKLIFWTTLCLRKSSSSNANFFNILIGVLG